MAILDETKLAMRITTGAYDSEITSLINAAQLDLGVAGVVVPEELDALVKRAIITYVRLNFGTPDDYDNLYRSYWEQKAQLATHSGYTNWGDSDAES